MLLELRVVLMEFAHARLAMKDLTVVIVRKDIARHKMEHVKVCIKSFTQSKVYTMHVRILSKCKSYSPKFESLIHNISLKAATELTPLTLILCSQLVSSNFRDGHT